MASQLADHFILIVESDPPTALNMGQAFQQVGARVVTSGSVQLALELVEADMWSAAVLGPTLSEIDSGQFCERLNERNIPFLLYVGSTRIAVACSEAPSVYLSAGPGMLVQTVEDLVQRRSTLH